MNFNEQFDSTEECINELWGHPNWVQAFKGWKFESIEDHRNVEMFLNEANSLEGWIYIGSDVGKPNIAKIGMTAREISTRERCSQNPFYRIIFAFKVNRMNIGNIRNLEQQIIHQLSYSYRRINHVSTGNPSEWFEISPQNLIDFCFYFIESELMDAFATIGIENADIAALIDEGVPHLQPEYSYELMGWDLTKDRGEPFAHVQNPNKLGRLKPIMNIPFVVL